MTFSLGFLATKHKFLWVWVMEVVGLDLICGSRLIRWLWLWRFFFFFFFFLLLFVVAADLVGGPWRRWWVDVDVVGGCGGYFFFSALVCDCGGSGWWLVAAMVGGCGGCDMGG